jgi:hypothetical protein
MNWLKTGVRRFRLSEWLGRTQRAGRVVVRRVRDELQAGVGNPAHRSVLVSDEDESTLAMMQGHAVSYRQGELKCGEVAHDLPSAVLMRHPGGRYPTLATVRSSAPGPPKYVGFFGLVGVDQHAVAGLEGDRIFIGALIWHGYDGHSLGWEDEQHCDWHLWWLLCGLAFELRDVPLAGTSA